MWVAEIEVQYPVPSKVFIRSLSRRRVRRLLRLWIKGYIKRYYAEVSGNPYTYWTFIESLDSAQEALFCDGVYYEGRFWWLFRYF